ncbi:NAD(P)-dependent oxidoreductase [Bacteroidota bacterium]|nr:NAD(P)-dependent oxidoreductase [Bacteroidota bacterium]
MRKSVLVSGSNGQLGRALQEASRFFPDLKIDFLDRNQLDLSQIGTKGKKIAWPKELLDTHYDYYIHAAAYTAVDQAEKDVKLCFQVNALAVKHLAEYLSTKNTKFIYISSDYVYHSLQNTPFTEKDLPQPKGVYARSKLAGEEAVKQTIADYLIFRTSWVYGEHGKNFVKTMDRLGKERDEINVVFDQIGSPTWVYDLAKMLLIIIDNGKAKETIGIFNYSNEGICSWYDFALSVMQFRGYSTKIFPVRTTAFPLPAPRPAFSVMDKSHFKETFGLDIPHWRESLHKCLNSLRD